MTLESFSHWWSATICTSLKLHVLLIWVAKTRDVLWYFNISFKFDDSEWNLQIGRWLILWQTHSFRSANLYRPIKSQKSEYLLQQDISVGPINSSLFTYFFIFFKFSNEFPLQVSYSLLCGSCALWSILTHLFLAPPLYQRRYDRRHPSDQLT